MRAVIVAREVERFSLCSWTESIGVISAIMSVVAGRRVTDPVPTSSTKVLEVAGYCFSNVQSLGTLRNKEHTATRIWPRGTEAWLQLDLGYVQAPSVSQSRSYFHTTGLCSAKATGKYSCISVSEDRFSPSQPHKNRSVQSLRQT
ncbi:hypothetical protein SCLCIDRAFT_251401 [Scleroderma citrinum Foug A]|uniref:Uncharacterized protein n=1 Tax=Scleroderma citrinum Foug A TaxID=1036808 RepID=A0A0C3EEL5_9AGAM|nr:hypothetical protein SCLCIDRAFT_251401 [Scleroderma citrinum Foug A]